MKSKTILSLLFIFEIVIGIAVILMGVFKSSPILVGLGISVAIAHLIEYFLLSKTA